MARSIMILSIALLLASTVEAQGKAGLGVAEAVVAALQGALVASAVNVDVGPEVAPDLVPFLPLAEDLGTLFVALARGLPERLTVRVQGALARRPGVRHRGRRPRPRWPGKRWLRSAASGGWPRQSGGFFQQIIPDQARIDP